MNVFTRLWLNARLKRGLARNHCRLDSGIRGLRNEGELTLEQGVKLHDIKIFSRQLQIGAYTDIVSGSELHHVSHIGRYCSVAARVVIGQDRRSHPLDWLSTSHAVLKARLDQAPDAQSATDPGPDFPTTIGHDVWIGRDVIIMKGVTIGTGAVVGAQSLVNKDVPPYAIVAGSPARVVRYRFDEATRNALMATSWWEYPLEALGSLAIENPSLLIAQLGSNRPLQRLPTTTLKVSNLPLRIKMG
ncbi:CatB-related O-acetyltransferase [Pseudomonas sp. Marseille-Q5115]|uniref:CatB-related O-acetyltransferase n=1 Tax=Pseudomonas sp. Marseille-Q5115 TaxID=2866593 RepID=UPI00298EE50E|nr:CatB-related O-acetyltransferase [Pseudomonas sp. Marseille-Q5115]